MKRRYTSCLKAGYTCWSVSAGYLNSWLNLGICNLISIEEERDSEEVSDLVLLPSGWEEEELEKLKLFIPEEVAPLPLLKRRGSLSDLMKRNLADLNERNSDISIRRLLLFREERNWNSSVCWEGMLSRRLREMAWRKIMTHLKCDGSQWNAEKGMYVTYTLNLITFSHYEAH